METIQTKLETAFRAAIAAALKIEGADPMVTSAQNPQFGDYQSNAAMGLAKTLAAKTGEKSNPRQIAEKIKTALELGEIASPADVTIAGPGFINVRLSSKWVVGRLNEAARDARLGIAPAEKPEKTVIDYSGPNIAKQMHVGHLRSTIIGDAISRVVEFLNGEENTIRRNHIGDWGTQFGRVVLGLWYDASSRHFHAEEKLTDWINRAKQVAAKLAPRRELVAVLQEIQPLHQQWIDADPTGEKIFLPYLNNQFPSLERLEQLYTFATGTFDTEEAAAIRIQHPRDGDCTLAELPRRVAVFVQNPGDVKNDQEKLAWKRATEVTLETCREIYRRLGVQLAAEHERGESFYNPFLADRVKELADKKIAVESDGAIVVFVDGPDKPPMIIQKSDGGFLYATTDLTGVWYRVANPDGDRAKHLIYTHDSRQANHFRQVFWTARKVGWAGDDVRLDYAPFGTMLGEDGKPFKTRSGDTVKLKDLLDEAEQRGYEIAKSKSADRGTITSDDDLKRIGRSIGIGGVKYADLSKDRTSDYVFNWEKMLAMDGNTGPYLQYAYARTQSIFRRGGVSGADFSVSTLEAAQELSLAKHILRSGEVIELAARDLKPHLLCTYLYDLATHFSAFFENCPVLQSPEPTKSSRLALCNLTARTMALGLDLLGIEHPEQM